MRRVLLLGLLIGLAGTGTAEAKQRHHRHAHHAVARVDPVAFMRWLAPLWWGTQACGGNYTVTLTTLPGAEAGYTDWLGPDGPRTARNPTAFTNCTMLLEAPNKTVPLRPNWPNFCQAFLHEFGHLAGHAHSTDPTNIMYPGAWNTNMPSVCLFSPYGDRFPHGWGSTGHL